MKHLHIWVFLFAFAAVTANMESCTLLQRLHRIEKRHPELFHDSTQGKALPPKDTSAFNHLTDSAAKSITNVLVLDTSGRSAHDKQLIDSTHKADVANCRKVVYLYSVQIKKEFIDKPCITGVLTYHFPQGDVILSQQGNKINVRLKTLPIVPNSSEKSNSWYKWLILAAGIAGLILGWKLRK
jgi:hypothetical protein